MAISYQEAVEKTIIAAEQLNQIVNGAATTEVVVEDGSTVPSVRKALVDNFYFKNPIPWQQGQSESVFNQLRHFTDGTLWYPPTAGVSNPVLMTSSPYTDPLWRIYSFDATVTLTPLIIEALRRSYVEAGFNLVTGSFTQGGVLSSTEDVLLDSNTGVAYQWGGAFPKTVAAGTDPTVAGSGYLPVSSQSLRQQISNPDGAKLVGFVQNGAAAIVRTVLSKLRDQIDADDFAVGDWITDDTVGLQRAIDVAVASGRPLSLASNKVYRVTPSTSVTWEGGTCLAALLLRSNLTVISNGATIKISNNVSTDSNPVQHQMFFTNEVLHDVTFYGVVFDMNGQNNNISPNRPTTFNRFMNAPICVSGTVGGAATAASIDRCNIIDCRFLNLAGVSGIVCSQTNTVGSRIGTGWNILFNTFENVGLDTDDHSSIYGRAKNLLVVGNTFKNPTTINPATKTGGLCAVEIHASDSVAALNTIINYEQGFWVAANFTETITSNIRVFANSARVNSTFIDFWSKNLLPYGEPEGAIKQVSIAGNTIEIIGAPSDFQVRSFFKCGARQQPALVDFSDNVCRSFDTNGNTVLALIVVGSDQRLRADQITISNNTGSGIRAGLVAYFDGTQTSALTKNIERVTYSNNDLGYLAVSSSTGLAKSDIYLYGPAEGVVEQLRVNGLRSNPQIVTDNNVAGRAKLYGSCKVPSNVTWDGVTSIGGGSTTSTVTIDTDKGWVDIICTLSTDTSSVVSGAVFPRFSGITATSEGFASANLIKAASAITIPCRVYSGSSWASLFNGNGTTFDANALSGGGYLSLNAKIPCDYIII